MTGNGETMHVAHLLPGYVAGTLDARDVRMVLAHLGDCPACRGELGVWQVIQRAAREAFEDVDRTDDQVVLERVWHRLGASTNPDQPYQLPAPAAITPSRGMARLTKPRRFVSEPPVRRPVAHLATAALLVLTLVASLFAFGPGRSWRMNSVLPLLPALVGTPATPEAVLTEMLLDTTISALPAGRNMVAVDRWRLRPSPAAVILPAHEGTILMTVESGEITVTVNGSDHRLEAGEALEVANHEFAFRASGSAEAVAYAVYVTPRFPGFGANRFWLSGDPLVHASDGVISSSADDLPGGPGRLVLERLTVPPGSALPPQEASPLVWTEVGSGELGLTLDGERLPYDWTPGVERTFFPFGREILPHPSPGTTTLMRNAGDDPLVLYRLTLAPSGTGASNDAVPQRTSATPSG